MDAVFRDQERVAVLNCNFLKPRNESLKYIVLNMWLRLIFRKRDENSGFPRALLEIRELKILPRRSSETLSTSRR